MHQKHKFLECAKWYRGTLIPTGLWFLQVLSSHNFVAFHHYYCCATFKASLNSEYLR